MPPKFASIERHFTAIENKGGGALVMNLAGHFPFAQTNVDPDCAAWLDLIAQMEKNLYEQDIVPSDLVFFVYRVN